MLSRGCVLRQPHLRCQTQRLQHFFSTRPKDDKNYDDDDGGGEVSNRQGFVQERFLPDSRKWNSDANFISAEDFANRPKVTFHEEFESIFEAGETLSWISGKEQDKIYQLYLDTMESMAKDGGATSHEYVMEVVAKKFDITPIRAAAIIRCLHEEDRIRANPSLNDEDYIEYDLQEIVDRKIQEHIEEAYGAYREKQPSRFTETPPLLHANKDSRRLIHVPDNVDLDELELAGERKIDEQEQHKLDTRRYKEDIDETTVFVQLDKDSKKLMSKKNQYEEAKRKLALDGTESSNVHESESPTSRWTYVAHVINTKENTKNVNKKKKKKKGEDVTNTLVEENGKLRPATLAESKSLSWKKVHSPIEFIYRDVQEAWLKKQLNNEEGVWGRVERKEKVQALDSQNDENDIDDVETSSESSSST